MRFVPGPGDCARHYLQRDCTVRPALTRHNFCRFLRSRSVWFASEVMLEHAKCSNEVTYLVLMRQVLGAERFCEAIEKPYPARDKEHQKDEYGGVHLHSLAAIVFQPQLATAGFFRPSQDCSR